MTDALTLDLPVDPGAPRIAREATAAVVRRRAPMADPDAVDDLLLLVSEAVTNAVDHAGGPAVELAIEVEPATASVSVRDRGRGFRVDASPTMPERTAERGRGIAIMAALADRFDVDATASGTTVALTKHLV